jgi:hypothetical protein
MGISLPIVRVANSHTILSVPSVVLTTQIQWTTWDVGTVDLYCLLSAQVRTLQHHGGSVV